MPTPAKGPRMGGSPAHERLMLANLATSLFEHGRITTTEAKAKRLRPYAEKLITFGKRGDLHARRQVAKVIRDKSVIHELFAEIGPRYTNRPGGYTRIVKIGNRKGDNAPMAIIELVEAMTAAQSTVGEAERARGTKSAPKKAATPATAEAAEELAGESDTAAGVAAAAAAQPETDVAPSGEDSPDSPASAAGPDEVPADAPQPDASEATGLPAEQVDNAAGDVTQDLTGGELSEPADESDSK